VTTHWVTARTLVLALGMVLVVHPGDDSGIPVVWTAAAVRWLGINVLADDQGVLYEGDPKIWRHNAGTGSKVRQAHLIGQKTASRDCRWGNGPGVAAAYNWRPIAPRMSGWNGPAVARKSPIPAPPDEWWRKRRGRMHWRGVI